MGTGVWIWGGRQRNWGGKLGGTGTGTRREWGCRWGAPGRGVGWGRRGMSQAGGVPGGSREGGKRGLPSPRAGKGGDCPGGAQEKLGAGGDEFWGAGEENQRRGGRDTRTVLGSRQGRAKGPPGVGDEGMAVGGAGARQGFGGCSSTVWGAARVWGGHGHPEPLGLHFGVCGGNLQSMTPALKSPEGAMRGRAASHGTAGSVGGSPQTHRDVPLGRPAPSRWLRSRALVGLGGIGAPGAVLGGTAGNSGEPKSAPGFAAFLQRDLGRGTRPPPITPRSRRRRTERIPGTAPGAEPGFTCEPQRRGDPLREPQEAFYSAFCPETPWNWEAERR